MSSVNLKRQKELNSKMSEVMDDFDRFEYFCARHWKKFVIAAVAVVIIVAAVFGVKAWQDNRKKTAAEVLDKAQNVEELGAALEKYGSYPSAQPARLRLATLYVGQGDYAKARAVLTEAAKAETPEIAWRAQLNLAAVSELEGNFAEAADAYAAFFHQESSPASSVYRVEAAVSAGRLYLKAGNPDAAREILKSGRALMQETPVAQGFTMQLDYLFAQLPVSAQ